MRNLQLEPVMSSPWIVFESWQKCYDDSKKELQMAIERAVKAESHISNAKK